MKPAAFEYFVPSCVDETLSLLSEFGDDCKILAGGQSLVPFLNFRMLRPVCLIDINRVANLAYVRQESDGAPTGESVRHLPEPAQPRVRRRPPPPPPCPTRRERGRAAQRVTRRASREHRHSAPQVYAPEGWIA